MLIFLDLANIESGGKPFGLLHYGDLLAYLSEGRFLVDAYAYVPIDPRRPEERHPLIHHLQRHGWMVNSKMGKIAGGSYKGNLDIEMCMDMVDAAHQIHPDIIVLCTGDGDFLPLVRRLRRMGIRVEVAAFENSVNADLPYEASGFISLDVWQKEFLAAYMPGENQEFHPLIFDEELQEKNVFSTNDIDDEYFEDDLYSDGAIRSSAFKTPEENKDNKFYSSNSDEDVDGKNDFMSESTIDENLSNKIVNFRL